MTYKTSGDHPTKFSVDDTDRISAESKNFNNTDDISKVTTHSATNLPNEKFYLGEATSRSLLNGIKGQQEGDMQDIDKDQREDVLNLLSNVIISSENLSEEDQHKELKNIQNAIDKNGLSYAINRWLGKKLNKYECRLLRVIRRIAYQFVLEEFNRTGKKSFSYNIEISMSEIYEKWGLRKRSQKYGGGYDNNQTKIIRDLLFCENNLHKAILFKKKYVTKTRYILQVEEISRTVVIEDTETKIVKKVDQIYGVKITLPEFLFICDDDLTNESNSEGYIYQDSDGFSRFMSVKGMDKNKSAFPLAEYLEEILSCKQEVRMLDLKTILREAELDKLYEKRPPRATEKINNILDKMKEAKFLISDWKFDKKGGKHDQGQYELHNIRSKLFASQKLGKSTKSRKTPVRK